MARNGNPALTQRENGKRRADLAAQERDLIAARVVFRDPCFACGVPAHRHDTDGCAAMRPFQF